MIHDPELRYRVHTINIKTPLTIHKQFISIKCEKSYLHCIIPINLLKNNNGVDTIEISKNRLISL